MHLVVHVMDAPFVRNFSLLNSVIELQWNNSTAIAKLQILKSEKQKNKLPWRGPCMEPM